MMFGIDGFEVVCCICNMFEYQDICIIFFIVKGIQVDCFQGYVIGGEVYFIKFFDNKEFINIINEVVEFG